jgi:hypothetical protein
MGMYKFAIALFAIMILTVSCKVPKSQHTSVSPEHRFESEAVEAPEPVETAESVVETEPAEFDPDSVPPEVYQETKQDIIHFIQNLNSIIKAKRYSVWTQYLDTDYYKYISSPEYLQKLSRAEILASKRIVLSDAYDYFMYVVVPSRSNDRIDDIEFLSENRIRAITINNGIRVILYVLEKTQSGWKIVIPNSTR